MFQPIIKTIGNADSNIKEVWNQNQNLMDSFTVVNISIPD